jgi:hypothetical protein
MQEISPGARLSVTDWKGQKHKRVAITPAIDGEDFRVVWACRETEWQDAQREGREPEGLPWPESDVELAPDAP